MESGLLIYLSPRHLIKEGKPFAVSKLPLLPWRDVRRSLIFPSASAPFQGLGFGPNALDLGPSKLLSTPAGGRAGPVATEGGRRDRLSVVCSRAGDAAGVVVGHGVRHPHGPPGIPQVWQGERHRRSEPQV